ncbi:HAD family hydrolase [Planococcus sp. ISL-109]|uniref:HAD family hydrolase n=1 Tax=Planococcus sp. ISL-109 TaxID=2819166 RepID=UPI001BEBEF38|nr:HAD family hydrolase [Planococcus sp. ISL-109]MBT2582225.1 HAD family hydrolase [Planococcus sp. ISL-109]
MSSWLACIDLDGTMLTSSEKVTSYTREVIQDFRAEGNKVAIVTGRHPLSTFPIIKMSGKMDGIACFNGSWVQGLGGGQIHAVFFEQEDHESISRELTELNVPVIWSTDNAFYVTNAPVRFPLEQGLVPVIDGNLPVGEKVWKITLRIESEKQRGEIREWCMRQQAIEWIESSPSTMDLHPLNQSKGLALQKLADSYNIPLSKTIAIGNWDNDLSMIEKAQIGVAMTNSSKSLFSVANEIAGHHDDHGVAKWLFSHSQSLVKKV